MGRRCLTATKFNKDEKWYLSEAARLLQEAVKVMHAKARAAAKPARAAKAARPQKATKPDTAE